MRTLGIIALLLGLAACGGDATLPAGAAGRYALAAVNGQALPFTLPGTAAGVTVTVEEGRLTLDEGGDFFLVILTHTATADPGDTDPGELRAETAGTVTASGSTLRFRPRFESPFTGTLTGAGLVYTRPAGGVDLQYAFVRS